MKIKNLLKSIKLGFFRAFRRFPVSLVLSAAVAIMLIIIQEFRMSYGLKSTYTLEKVAMILALGIPFSLCIKVFIEKKNIRKIISQVIYYILGVLALGLYYYLFLDKVSMVSTTRYISISLALYVCFLFIPYLNSQKEYEMYVIRIFSGFFTTVIYAIVLFLGLAAILFTINRLLGVHIDSKIYYYTWLLVALVFAPSYFLSEIPCKDDEQNANDYPKLLKIMILYIVMPLLTVYTAILYIYFVKIIITRQWPVGLVSHLVLWYSVLTAMVLFFIEPIRKINRWAERFAQIIPKTILPVLIMMFVSMGIRINAYGITENRYYVLALGIWALFVMAYFSFVKSPKGIFLPVILSIIAVVAVFGPLSSYSISKFSQNSRLDEILRRNDMIANGKISPSNNISEKDKKEICRILDYFRNSHSLRDVRYLPKNFKIESMNKTFGFAYDNPGYGSPQDYISVIAEQTGYPIDIAGYDYLFDSKFLYNTKDNNGDMDIIYDNATGKGMLKYRGDTLYSIDLSKFVKKLVNKYGYGSKGSNLPLNDMTFIDENNRARIKIIFTNVFGQRNVSSGDIETRGLEFYMMVKVK